MSQTKPWVKALKINLGDYEEWSESVPSEENITYWALIKGKIKPQDYLHWAREYYQLPVLKEAWFNNHCNHKLWSQIQSVANWSPQMMPIEEWEGTIYVAVVEPPEDCQWSFPVCYVLAPARSLKKHWKALQNGPSQPESIEIPDTPTTSGEAEPEIYPSDNGLPPIPESLPNIPDALDVPHFEMTDSAVNVDKKTMDDVDHLASIEIPTVSPDMSDASSEPLLEAPPMDLELNLPEPPQTHTQNPGPPPKVASAEDSPEGISSLNLPDSVASDASPEGISLNLPDPLSSDASPEGISLNLPESDGTPEGIMALDDTLTLPSVTIPEPVSIDEPSTEVPTAAEFTEPDSESLLPQIPSEPIIEETAQDSTLDTLGAKKQPEFKLKFDIEEGGITDDSVPNPTQLTNTTHTNEGTVTRFAITVTGLNKEAPRDAVIDTEKTAPHTSDSCSNESEATAWLFSELKSHFQQSMILLLNGEDLKPWKWENTWTPKNKQAFEAFNPDQPGLFRIIKRTKQPYHGYVVSSPLNKEFFKQWGFDALPEHVTALPMIVENHLSGIILSLGDESSGSDRALMDASKIVDEFVNTIVRITSKAA